MGGVFAILFSETLLRYLQNNIQFSKIPFHAVRKHFQFSKIRVTYHTINNYLI